MNVDGDVHCCYEWVGAFGFNGVAGLAGYGLFDSRRLAQVLMAGLGMRYAALHCTALQMGVGFVILV